MHHPEQLRNEVWVGNVMAGELPARLRGFTTARLGKQAYCIHGTKLAADYMLPLFIGRSEMARYDQLMMSKDYPILE